VASRSPLHVQAATLGFVVLAIPQPVLGESGRRKGFRLKFRRCYRLFRSGNLTANRARDAEKLVTTRGREWGHSRQTNPFKIRAQSAIAGRPSLVICGKGPL